MDKTPSPSTPTIDATPKHTASRGRRALRRSFVAAILLVVIVGAIAASYEWRNRSIRQSMLEEIRSAGHPVSLRDLEPPPMDPTLNAATYLDPIGADADALYLKIESILDPETTPFDYRQPLSPEKSQVVVDAFEQYQHVLDAMDQASTCTADQPDWDYSASPEPFMTQLFSSSRQKSVARVHLCRMRWLAVSGNPDKAVGEAINQLHLSELAGQQPLVVSFLLSIACSDLYVVEELNQIIQTMPLQRNTHQQIESALASYAPMARFLHAIRTERAYGNSSIHHFSEAIGASFHRNGIAYLKAIAIEERLAQVLPADRDQSPNKNAAPLVQLAVDAIRVGRQNADRSAARSRCLRVINAIYAKSMQASARIDLSSETLGLPADILVDPYNGQPLIVRKSETGWHVYSVGENGQDDQADCIAGNDVGLIAPK